MGSPAVTATPPASLPADFNGWDKPVAHKHVDQHNSTAPKTLPADFKGWDAHQPSAHQATPEEEQIARARKFADEHPENVIKPWNPSWHEKLFGGRGGFRGAVEDAHQAGEGGKSITGFGSNRVEQFVAFANHPLAAFEELFPNSPTSTAGQVAKGAARVASGMTSPTQLAMLLAPMGLAKMGATTTTTALHAVGTAMMPTMATGVYESAGKIKQARATGDTEAENEAWGDIAANVAMVAVPHAGGKMLERVGAREINTHARTIYGKDFKSLDDNQKVHVMYTAAEDASPKFKAKIDREMQKLNSQKVPGRGGQTVAEHRAALSDDMLKQAFDRETRLRAAKAVLVQAMQRQAAEEHYKQAHAHVEAEIHAERAENHERELRRQQYQAERARAGEDGQSLESQRGFAVTDNRTNTRGVRGVVMSTERTPGQMYDPEPAPAGGVSLNDRRSVVSDIPTRQAASAMERPIQEFAEQRMGASFSSLPLDRQRVVARYFERHSPEQWDAFKGTQAYDAYSRHAAVVDATAPVIRSYMQRTEGSGAPELNEGADQFIGVSRLLMQRSDVASALKANPEVYRAVNEQAERDFGHSFDTLDEANKPAALANYLRENPDKVSVLANPDVAERMRQGQHVDLANMEAELRDKQQISVLMSHREATRAALDEHFAGQVVREQRAAHTGAIREFIEQAGSTETGIGEAVTGQARNLTRIAEAINLDSIRDVRDLFHVEQSVRAVPVGDRTPEMGQYLAQIRQLRSTVETEIVRSYRENLIARMREDIQSSRPTVVREIINFEDQRHTALRLADDKSGEHATPEQKAEAQGLRDTADFIERKEDAAVIAAQMVNAEKSAEPAFRPELPTQESAPATVGRADKVMLNSGEEVPVHYAVMEADDLITSHRTSNFEVDPRYPSEAQPRDYRVEKELQTSVEERVMRLDPGQVASDSTLPVVGPPIILKDGVVLSGNGRTQSMKLAIERGHYGNMRKALAERAQQFGLNAETVEGMRNPVLVRVMDNMVTDPAELARYGIEMNRDPAQGMSESEQAVALSRLLTPNVVERLAGVAESLPEGVSVREIMRRRATNIGEILKDAGLIDPKKRAQYFTTDGDLTGTAKDLLENVMAGLTVTSPDVIRRASPSVRDRLARVGIEFVKMRRAGESWNLASYNNDAVSLMTRAEDAAGRLREMEGRDVTKNEQNGGESLIERLLHPERYRLSNYTLDLDGQAAVPPVHPAVEALAMALEERPREYAKMVGQYALEASNGGATMFGAIDPSEVFNDKIGSKFGLKVLPEEWGMVSALPDEAREQIEETRGPLSVSPSDHEAIVRENLAPDTSSVEDARRSSEIRSIRQFRDALAQHPNITEEQAQAIGDIFERVLPQATGESFEDILANRRLSLSMGGEDGERRGYTDYVDEANTAIHLFEKAEPSTVMHEMFHMLRRYLKPEHQGALNEFVGAKAGEDWSVEQEERAAQAFERYHFDGGRRRGTLEKAFAVIHRAMQSVYDAVTGRGLVEPSPRIREMFDKWYDWTRNERVSITKRTDLAALEKAAAGKVTIPKDAKMIAGANKGPFDKNDRTLVFTSVEEADKFARKNDKVVRQTYLSKDGKTVYVQAKPKGRLYQSGMSSLGDMARQIRELEARLKNTRDPREEARLRANLNSLENRMGGASFVIGGKPEVRATEATQMIYGMAEMPSVHEPTTPAQAMQARQVHGDPTALEIATNGARDVRPLPDETAGLPDANGTPQLSERAGDADGGDEAAGSGLPRRKPTNGGSGGSAPARAVNPLSKMDAATLKAPDRPRGMPLVDAEAWRGHVEALGLPEGTPPPTVRIPDDLRDMMIFPGQAEAVEVALSGLQQYDAVMMAAPTGSGKTFMGMAIADQLLGQDSSKVGLVVTISQNLIHAADGYVETGQRLGVQVDNFPKDLDDVQGGGVYAATYSGIRGNKDILSVPWDFVIFDESAAGRNWTEAEQGKAVVMLGHAAKKVVYMSATPWHTALETGYAHKLGLWPEGGFFGWARQFGLVETGPNSYSGGYAPKKMMKLRQQLVERGQWVALHRDLDGVSAHVALVPQTEEVKAGIKSIRDAFALASKIFREQGRTSQARSLAGHEVTYLKRYIESARLPEVLAKAKEAIAGGWQPAIFSEYRSGSKTEVDGKIEDMFSKLPPGMADSVRKMLPRLPNLVDAVREALGEDAAVFAGDANQLREDERTAYQAGKKKGLFTTYAAGGTGVSFHDRVGDKPRMGLFLGLPWSGIMFEQSQGRTWRYGTKSNVANVFFTSDTLPEMKVLATKILPRMRALNAAVYGEEMENRLSQRLRASSGIPEEMIGYEMGNEAVPEAAHFEHTAEGVDYTTAANLKLPDATEAKNKGMKYKQQPKRLYQGPPDPLGREAREVFDKLPMGNLHPSLRRALEANRARIMATAVDAGRQAVPGVEAPQQAVNRVIKDASIDAKMIYDMRGMTAGFMQGERVMSATYDAKHDSRAGGRAVKEWLRLRHTSGDRAVAQYFADAGMAKEGKEVQGKLIERQHLITEHRGDLMSKVADITEDIAPHEHDLVVKVLEGKTASTDERINKAAEGYRKFFDDVRKQLGSAGAVFRSVGKDGKPIEIPWSQFEERPNYFPHIWDWNQKIYFEAKDGQPATMKTLGDLHDMKPGEEKNRLIEEYAGKRGIDKLQALDFFSKNRRSIRLAPNLERTRETEIPGYDTSLRTMGVYINQVSEMLANIQTVGQEREKINPALYRLPLESMRVVDSIVSADLNPATIGSDNSIALRRLSQWTVLSKMGMSVLKLPTHILLKTPLVTNTRSLIGGMLEFARHPVEITRMSREAGILTDYVRQAMMMEYGLHTDSGLDRKLLKYTGFTSGVWLSRVIAGAAGRHFLTVHAEPALRKNPNDTVLRRKLSDLYGYSEEDLNRIATNGIDERDVKRAMIAGADWTTGSGRASELPPALRSGDDHPINQNFRMLYRLTYMLKTYTFKTAALVNRTVFDELRQPGFKGKDYKPLLRLMVNGGAAGLALTGLQMGINSVANPAAEEEQKRRFEAIKDHPQAAVWMELSCLSYALGIYPAKVLFDRLGTYNAGDVKKFETTKRLENAFAENSLGILAGDADHIVRAVVQYAETFGEDGVHHKAAPSERRAQILNQLGKEIFAPLKAAEGAAHLLTGTKEPSDTAGQGSAPVHRRARPVRARRRR